MSKVKLYVTQVERPLEIFAFDVDKICCLGGSNYLAQLSTSLADGVLLVEGTVITVKCSDCKQMREFLRHDGEYIPVM